MDLLPATTGLLPGHGCGGAQKHRFGKFVDSPEHVTGDASKPPGRKEAQEHNGSGGQGCENEQGRGVHEQCDD